MNQGGQVAIDFYFPGDHACQLEVLSQFSLEDSENYVSELVAFPSTFPTFQRKERHKFQFCESIL
jgi:hypothetical protein